MSTVDAVHGAGQTLAAAASAPVSPDTAAEHRELIRAIKAINPSELFGQNCELTFVLDRETRRPVVRVIDRETNEVIQQIPPEYLLRMAEDLKTSRGEE
ncbi:MAG: flagellar protein FlaG [Rhodospirillales bacterium]